MLDYCKILSDAENNVSDHLAISVAISISIGKSDERIESVLGDKSNVDVTEFIKYNWDDKRFREMYAQIIKNDLQKVSILSVTDLNETSAPGYVNGLCDKLCGIMHNAAKKSYDVV